MALTLTHCVCVQLFLDHLQGGILHPFPGTYRPEAENVLLGAVFRTKEGKERQIQGGKGSLQ